MASLDVTSLEFEDSVGQAAGSLVFVSPFEQKKAKRWQAGWRDTKGAAFLAWTYRDTPWSEEAKSVRLPKGKSPEKSKGLRSATPSTRAPSRALASPDFRTPTPQSRLPGDARSPTPQTSQQKGFAPLGSGEERVLFSPRKPTTPKPKKKASPRKTPEDKSVQEADSLMAMSEISSATSRASVLESGAAVGRWMRRASEKGNHAALASLLQSAAGVDESELLDTMKNLQIGGSAPSSSALVGSQEWSMLQSKTRSHDEVIAGLGAAAEAAGAKARGDISLAIRAQAVCRHNFAAAARKLTHLQGAHLGNQQEDEADWESAGSEVFDSEPRNAMSEWQHMSQSFTAADLAESNTNSVQADGRGKSIRQSVAVDPHFFAAVLGSKKGVASGKVNRRRRIEVLQNTTLGKMVSADPEKAEKHGLVAVPPWYHNKPWPPPPISLDNSKVKLDWGTGIRPDPRKSTFYAKDNEDSPLARRPTERQVSDLAEEEETSAAKDRSEHEEVAMMVSDLLSESKDNNREQASLTRGGMRKGVGAQLRQQTTKDTKKIRLNVAEAAEDEEEPWDYLTILMKADSAKKAQYTKVFHTYAHNTGYLVREKLCRALREVGMAPRTVLERQRLKEVQHRIIQDFRSSEDDWKAALHGKAPGSSQVPEKCVRNPLTDGNGGWVLNEFLVMTAVSKELSNQDQKEVDEALSVRLDCPLTVVRDLKEVYRTATGDLKEMTIKGFVAILSKAGLSGPRDEDLCSLLDIRHTKGDALDRSRKVPVEDFVGSMIRVEEILKKQQLEKEFEELQAQGGVDVGFSSVRGDVLDSETWNSMGGPRGSFISTRAALD